MTRTNRVVWLTPAVVALAGCWDPAWPGVPVDGVTTDTPDAGVVVGDFTWFQDVRPIIQRNCATCHADPPRFAATRSLLDYGDTQAFDSSGRPVHEIMAERVVAQTGVMPPPSQGAMRQDDINIIRGWSAGGARMGTPVATHTWYQDIEPVIRETCHLCHGPTPQFSAPMSLVTYDDVTDRNASNQLIYELMAFRIQSTPRMPPATHMRQLTSDEIQMIIAWAEAGAPEGTPVVGRDGGMPDSGPPDSGPGVPWRGGPGSGPTGDPNTRWADAFAHASGDPTAPFDVPNGETIYECWSFLVPTSTVAALEYVTLMEPILDTTSNTHHLMIFIDDSGQNPSPAPVGPFTCDGFPYEAGGAVYAEFVDGWFPGRGVTAMPDGIGVPVQAGDRLILQVHYDRVMQPLADMSGIRLLLDSRDQYNGAETLWSGIIWSSPLQGVDMRQGECTLTQDVSLYRSLPHMHQYGTRIVTEVQRQGTGPFEVLVEIPAWNFDDQPVLDLPAPIRDLQAGDVLRTTCHWNTGGQTVRQGDGSLDEMCFNIFLSYPPHPNTGPGGICVESR